MDREKRKYVVALYRRINDIDDQIEQLHREKHLLMIEVRRLKYSSDTRRRFPNLSNGFDTLFQEVADDTEI